MSARTIVIEGGIYMGLDVHDREPRFIFFNGKKLERFASYTPVMPHTLTFTLPKDFQPQAAEIQALEALKEEAQRKFTETVMGINNRIQSLLAISNEAAPA